MRNDDIQEEVSLIESLIQPPVTTASASSSSSNNVGSSPPPSPVISRSPAVSLPSSPVIAPFVDSEEKIIRRSLFFCESDICDSLYELFNERRGRELVPCMERGVESFWIGSGGSMYKDHRYDNETSSEIDEKMIISMSTLDEMIKRLQKNDYAYLEVALKQTIDFQFKFIFGLDDSRAVHNFYNKAMSDDQFNVRIGWFLINAGARLFGLNSFVNPEKFQINMDYIDRINAKLYAILSFCTKNDNDFLEEWTSMRMILTFYNGIRRSWQEMQFSAYSMNRISTLIPIPNDQYRLLLFGNVCKPLDKTRNIECLMKEIVPRIMIDSVRLNMQTDCIMRPVYNCRNEYTHFYREDSKLTLEKYVIQKISDTSHRHISRIDHATVVANIRKIIPKVYKFDHTRICIGGLVYNKLDHSTVKLSKCKFGDSDPLSNFIDVPDDVHDPSIHRNIEPEAMLSSGTKLNEFIKVVKETKDSPFFKQEGIPDWYEEVKIPTLDAWLDYQFNNNNDNRFKIAECDSVKRIFYAMLGRLTYLNGQKKMLGMIPTRG